MREREREGEGGREREREREREISNKKRTHRCPLTKVANSLSVEQKISFNFEAFSSFTCIKKNQIKDYKTLQQASVKMDQKRNSPNLHECSMYQIHRKRIVNSTKS